MIKSINPPKVNDLYRMKRMIAIVDVEIVHIDSEVIRFTWWNGEHLMTTTAPIQWFNEQEKIKIP